MTNKRRDDAAVAEIMGHKVVTYNKRDTVEYRITEDSQHEGIAITTEVPPFITEPTGNTDQTVLEWVQGQIFSVRLEYFKKLNEIIQEPTDGFSIKWPDVLVHYKPGMYAKALLETQEDAHE